LHIVEGIASHSEELQEPWMCPHVDTDLVTNGTIPYNSSSSSLLSNSIAQKRKILLLKKIISCRNNSSREDARN
jgi:hypothetical protein